MNKTSPNPPTCSSTAKKITEKASATTSVFKLPMQMLFICISPHLFFSVMFLFLIGTSVFYIARVAGGTCKQSQITWGCLPTSSSFFFFFFMFDIFWNEVISSSRRWCFMHDYIVLVCVKRRARSMKDLWHSVVKQGVMKGEQEWARGIRQSLSSTCSLLHRQSHVSMWWCVLEHVWHAYGCMYCYVIIEVIEYFFVSFLRFSF